MTKSKPIIFSGPMVCAILDNRKSMTRRVLKPSNATILGYNATKKWWAELDWDDVIQSGPACLSVGLDDNGERVRHRVRPRHEPSDLLYVKEVWRPLEREDGYDGANYRADDGFQIIENTIEASNAWGQASILKGKSDIKTWRSPIFMPRWASRITLEVTSVRIERLQEISEEDAAAEGAEEAPFTKAGREGHLLFTEGFENIWTSLYPTGPKSWSANPWVVVIEFKQVNQPMEG